MKTLPNVALVGWMRSGKDSVAAYLTETYGFRRVSFADALKSEVCQALNSVQPGIPGEPEAFWTPERLNQYKPLVRPILQWWGTEYRRSQDPDYWVRQTAALISGQKASRFVATDARFTNELDMLRAQGFRIVELSMSRVELMEYLHDHGTSPQKIDLLLSHPSEQEWQAYPKDASFVSKFGNLPELTAEVIGFLSGEPVTADEMPDIHEFYANLYPDLYCNAGQYRHGGSNA